MPIINMDGEFWERKWFLYAGYTMWSEYEVAVFPLPSVFRGVDPESSRGAS
ncbi:MAG: hypothetical protein GXP26_07685 [Planctomycetes bacterium]|nr:hypothetical protein [Planctomycetota bacterium]